MCGLSTGSPGWQSPEAPDPRDARGKTPEANYARAGTRDADLQIHVPVYEDPAKTPTGRAGAPRGAMRLRTDRVPRVTGHHTYSARQVLAPRRPEGLGSTPS